MNRAAILREALVRAATACLWAEESLVWGEGTPSRFLQARARREAQARLERVLSQAGREHFLAPEDQRHLLGRVLDAMAEARCRHDSALRDAARPFPVIENQLAAELRHVWAWAFRRRWLTPWRIAA
jgi:hypothetical protein